RCDAMRCDAMRCDAMRCDAMIIFIINHGCAMILNVVFLWGGFLDYGGVKWNRKKPEFSGSGFFAFREPFFRYQG
ncbi:MAG: hypothetical protein ACTTJV_09785, partial [Ottowia sp.]